MRPQNTTQCTLSRRNNSLRSVRCDVTLDGKLTLYSNSSPTFKCTAYSDYLATHNMYTASVNRYLQSHFCCVRHINEWERNGVTILGYSSALYFN